MKSGTTSLLEMLNLKDVGSALKEKVSTVDCVVPVYLLKDESGYQAVLHHTSMPMCLIPDDHISPRRSALFMARSVLRDIRDGARVC